MHNFAYNVYSCHCEHDASCHMTCLSVCLSVRKVYCGKMGDWIWMLFRVVSGVSQGMDVLDGGPCASRGRGGFWGRLPPLAQGFQWHIL